MQDLKELSHEVILLKIELDFPGNISVLEREFIEEKIRLQRNMDRKLEILKHSERMIPLVEWEKKKLFFEQTLNEKLYLIRMNGDPNFTYEFAGYKITKLSKIKQRANVTKTFLMSKLGKDKGANLFEESKTKEIESKVEISKK